MESEGKYTGIYTLSHMAIEELKAQAKKSGFDLLHDLMLNDYIETSDGFYLRRDKGHIFYDSFVGKPNLNKKIVDKMKREIEELTPETRKEVLTKIAMKFPDIASKIKDVYMKYKE
jgi:hypothetical protein